MPPEPRDLSLPQLQCVAGWQRNISTKFRLRHLSSAHPLLGQRVYSLTSLPCSMTSSLVGQRKEVHSTNSLQALQAVAAQDALYSAHVAQATSLFINITAVPVQGAKMEHKELGASRHPLEQSRTGPIGLVAAPGSLIEAFSGSRTSCVQLFGAFRAVRRGDLATKETSLTPLSLVVG